MMTRLCPFTGEHASEILEDIFVTLDRYKTRGLGLSDYELALWKRLKQYEINSAEVYENFYAVLAGKR